MPKKRAHISDDTLRQLASPNGSLFYETLMMKEVAARCVEPKGERSLRTDVPYNMAIEAFLIHFRNLRDFLYPDDPVADDVIAFDYDARWNKTREHWKECSNDERNRINKLLAHLSYSRPHLEHGWPIQVMCQKMMQSMAEFILSLPPARREWFKSWGLEKALGASGNK